MEITDENKIKAIAQYIGQQVSIPAGYQFNGYATDDTQGEFNGIRNEGFIHIGDIGGYYDFKNFQLILKPLSVVTDEDNIEVGKIIGNLSENFTDGNLTVIKISKMFIENLLTGRLSKNAVLVIIVFQYLQSRGYDLPQYILNGKTLKEAGLAIYQ